jgi:hypothetical protein
VSEKESLPVSHSGVEVTEGLAATVAEEFERDDSPLDEQAITIVHAGRGRPSLSGSRRHSPQVTFRVPDRLRARADEVAAREGKTVSQLAREALERYLAAS